MVRQFTRYRRRLPHFRLEHSAYYVTWRAHPSFGIMSNTARDIVLNAILHFNNDRYDLLGCAVMDDHVHLIVMPKPEWELEKLVHSWKSYSAHSINKLLDREGLVWLGEYHDRIIRDEDELYEKLTYIYNNPRERWPELREYPYLWIKGIN